LKNGISKKGTEVLKKEDLINTQEIFVNVKNCPSCGAKSFFGIMGKI
jgi:hypothetical protein